jgi:hypothetical protein
VYYTLSLSVNRAAFANIGTSLAVLETGAYNIICFIRSKTILESGAHILSRARPSVLYIFLYAIQLLPSHIDFD